MTAIWSAETSTSSTWGGWLRTETVTSAEADSLPSFTVTETVYCPACSKAREV